VTIISILADGLIIARDTANIKPTATGDYGIVVTINDLRKVLYVINTKLTFSPVTESPGDLSYESISHNIVGMSIANVGAGGTLTATLDAIGY